MIKKMINKIESVTALGTTPIDTSNFVTKNLTGAFYAASNPSGFITVSTSAIGAAVEWTPNHTLVDGTRYLAGDLVYSNGRIYKANYDNESVPVTNQLYWTDLGTGYRLNLDGRDILNIPVSPAIQLALDGKYPSNNPSGFVTSASLNLSNYVATSQTGAFYAASNPSGFITGVNLSSYVTSSQTGVFATTASLSAYVTDAETGVFYPTSNPSGYVRSTQTGEFYAASNPSGYVGSAGLVNLVSITGAQTISGSKTFVAPPLETKATPSISSSALTLDLSSASLFYVNLNSSVTITLSNVPASPKVHSFTLQFVGDGVARTVTWPNGTRWAGGTNPTLTSTLNKVDTFTFMTHDGGTNWFAFVSNQNQ